VFTYGKITPTLQNVTLGPALVYQNALSKTNGSATILRLRRRDTKILKKSVLFENHNLKYFLIIGNLTATHCDHNPLKKSLMKSAIMCFDDSLPGG